MEGDKSDFPKPVVMGFPPVIVWANNEEELKAAIKEADAFMLFAETMVLLSVAIVCGFAVYLLVLK